MSQATKKNAAPKPVKFTATLFRPKPQNGAARVPTWTFLKLPKTASAKLPSRGLVSVQGALNAADFQATLEPDGQGSHWLKVDKKLRERADAEPNDKVKVEVTPLAEEPEPEVPADIRKALAATPKAKEVWADITPVARRDWIHWIISGKKAETRTKRIATACDMLSKNKRRPCCFDRSGMYSKSLTCPEPLTDS